MDCPRCGRPMVRLKWSYRADMLVCDNYRCSAYHQPGPAVPKEGAIPEEKPKPPASEKTPLRRGRRSRWETGGS